MKLGIYIEKYVSTILVKEHSNQIQKEFNIL